MEKIGQRKGASLIKSKERVDEYGEVFTPEHIVAQMCDCLGDEAWSDPFKTFLEPSCGTGNFLVEILKRKYKLCQTEKDGLKALASVIGIEIQEDNCQECRGRLLEQFKTTFTTANDEVILLASQILDNNIICGDSLEIQREWIEQNENIEHDYSMSAMEWCKKYLPQLDKAPKKHGEQLSLFEQTKPPLFVDTWQIFDTARIDEIDL